MVKNEPEFKTPKKLIALGIIFLVIVVGIIPCITIVGAGYRGVIFNKFSGVKAEPFGEGLHLKGWFFEKIIKFEVRQVKYEIEAAAASKDLQVVRSTVAINYHLIPEATPELYQSVGNNFEFRIIAPAVQESVKAITARYNAENLLTERPIVREEMKEMLTKKLEPYGIILDAFNIVNFDFSDQFNQAIEAKVTAEQKALEEKWNLERVKFEAQQKIEKGKAEAEVLALQKQEITPDLIELRRIEMMMSAINRWDGVMPRFTGGAMPFIDITSIE